MSRQKTPSSEGKKSSNPKERKKAQMRGDPLLKSYSANPFARARKGEAKRKNGRFRGGMEAGWDVCNNRCSEDRPADSGEHCQALPVDHFQEFK